MKLPFETSNKRQDLSQQASKEANNGAYIKTLEKAPWEVVCEITANISKVIYKKAWATVTIVTSAT